MIINHSGISGSRTAYLLAARIKEEKKNLLAVVSSGQAAARLADDLVFYMPELNIIALPEEEDVQVLYEARDRGALVKRIQSLAALSEAPAGDALWALGGHPTAAGALDRYCVHTAGPPREAEKAPLSRKGSCHEVTEGIDDAGCSCFL